MMNYLNTVIIGTGSYIPEVIMPNTAFGDWTFYDKNNSRIESSAEEIAEKLEAITGIKERRYIRENQTTSEIAAIASKRAIENAGIDAETIDQIIFAHNYGDIKHSAIQGDFVPSLAARVKNELKIKNINCVAYDVIFGCPGWVQGFIQATHYIKAETAKRCLIIGAEALSRVSDKYDRDAMIFSDGAGAVVVEGKTEHQKRGVLHHAAQSHTLNETYYIYAGPSNNPAVNQSRTKIKMQGRKVYELALTAVPPAMKDALDNSGKLIGELKMIFIHQANEKMDEAIVKRFYRLYNKPMPEHIMPMSIGWLGNSSVATVPTLYDLVSKNKIPDYQLFAGDLIMFVSIGAGMHLNAIVYKV